eukprot:720472_1
MGVAFRIHPPRPPSQLMFSLSRWDGVAVPNADIEIVVKTKSGVSGEFSDELCVETELSGVREFFTVKGHCETSQVNASDFKTIHFKEALIGEVAKHEFSITNSGGFPLTYTMKATFPVKISPTQGVIDGQESVTFQVSWIPTGGYDLRSSISCHTNCGDYEIHVKGHGTYPRFTVQNATTDFGICAIGHTYTSTFLVINRGQVHIPWSIPNVDKCFEVSKRSGVIAINGRQEIELSFCPEDTKAYRASMVVESRGRYREINSVGIGGLLKLDHPEKLFVPECPVGHWTYHTFYVHNSGSVPLELNFSVMEQVAKLQATDIHCPPDVFLLAGEEAELQIGIRLDKCIQQSFTLMVKSYEQTWFIAVHTEGVVIELSKFCLALMNAHNETLSRTLACDVRTSCDPRADLYKTVAKSSNYATVRSVLSGIIEAIEFVHRSESEEIENILTRNSHAPVLLSNLMPEPQVEVYTSE